MQACYQHACVTTHRRRMQACYQHACGRDPSIQNRRRCYQHAWVTAPDDDDDGDAETTLRILGSVRETPAGDVGRDAGRGESSPFLEHAWLELLEETGCVGGDHGLDGWRTLSLWRSAEQLVCVAPSYLKGNSEGEFVFDWAWADLAERPLGVMAVLPEGRSSRCRSHPPRATACSSLPGTTGRARGAARRRRRRGSGASGQARRACTRSFRAPRRPTPGRRRGTCRASAFSSTGFAATRRRSTGTSRASPREAA